MSDETSVVRTIGRYHAVGELGRGGMGVVYRGFDPVIGRTVALKTIAFTADGAEGQQLRERLYREAAAAGTLTHTNIVTIYDVVEDGGTTAVAMELVEGSTLGDLIASKGPLPFDQALEIFQQLCSALDYAGTKGLVHRDIKPANILLTADGHVKVTDFGIARIAVSGVTQTGTIMGSPSYMSPEQVRGLALDPRSDLFSAAVVLYEMLTGARPFGGDDVATTMYRIVNEPPRALEQLNPSIGPAVSGVLERALSKNPADRYQSGSELVAELKGSFLLPGMPAPFSGPIVPPPAETSRRSPMLYVIGGLGTVLVAVVLIALLGGNNGTTPQQTTPDDPVTAQAEAQPAQGVEVAPTVELPTQYPSAPPAPYSGPVSTVPPLNSGPSRLPDPKPVAARASTSSDRTSESPAPVRRQPSRTQTAPAERPDTPVREAEQRALPPALRTWPDRAPAEAARPAPPAAVPAPALTPGESAIRVEFEGPPYPVTLFSDSTRLGRVEAAGGAVPVEPGDIHLRAVNEALFLNIDLGTVSVKAGERRAVSLPGTASVVVGVRGDDYAGLRILVDGRPLPGPYPAQVARIGAGAHQITYRWIGGTRAGTEFSETVTLAAGGHFVVRAVPDNAQIVVQQVR